MILSLILLATPVIVSAHGVRGEWDTFHGDAARSGIRPSGYISGDLLWTADPGNGYVVTSPVMDGERVYLVTSGNQGWDASVHSLEVTTGRPVWNTTIPGRTYQLSTPVIVNGMIFVGSSSGIFHALRADTGTIEWQRLIDPSLYGITSSPMYHPDTGAVIVGTGAGVLYALDPTDGSTRWSFDTGDAIYFSSPALCGDLVLVGNDAGTLFAVLDGDEKWRFHTGDRIRSSAAVGSGGIIYFTSRDGMLRSLFPNGTLRWSTEIGPSVSTPAVHGEIVISGSSTGLHAFDPEGSPLFSILDHAPVDSSPAVSDHQIFFTTNGSPGELIACDHSGTILWSIDLGDQSLSSPAIGRDTVLSAGDSGMVWCVHSTPPGELIIHPGTIPDTTEGERTITFTGWARYDTGRPASAIDMEVSILDRTATGWTSPNGSFEITMTLDLPPGIHRAVITGNDGHLMNRSTVDIHVRDRGEKERGSESPLPVPGFSAVEWIVAVLGIGLLGSRSRNGTRGNHVHPPRPGSKRYSMVGGEPSRPKTTGVNRSRDHIS